MSEKEKVLAQMDAMGIGYCSKAACESDEMGIGISWDDIKAVSLELLVDMKNYYERKV